MHAVYLILNSKGKNRLWSPWDRSCFQQVNLLLFLNITSFFCFKTFFCLFVLLCLYIELSSGGEEEDYIKCVMMSGGSTRHLNTASFCYCWLSAAHVSTRCVNCF